MVKKTLVKNLYRSDENRIIGGVCGGLGEYFNLDPVFIRVIFLLLALFGGSGIPIYFVLWLIVPDKSQLENDQEKTVQENIEEIKTKTKNFTKENNFKKLFGIFLVAVGIVLLMENFGFYFLSYFWKFWPVLIIVLGFFIVFKNERT